MAVTRIEEFDRYLDVPLVRQLWAAAKPPSDLCRVHLTRRLRDLSSPLLTTDALNFLAELFEDVADDLNAVLNQRRLDRAELDKRTAECHAENKDTPFHAPSYQTVIGWRNEAGKVLVGPSDAAAAPRPVDVPTFLHGYQVTLFGPPDTRKMAINAMNALHRKMPDEAPVITELVNASGDVPRWGADSEDSKTPMVDELIAANENLAACFARTIEFNDAKRGKNYTLESDRLAIPIKRIPGLPIPCGDLLIDGRPLPLHLVDFALHLFHNRNHREALVFYVPKLETAAEAQYLSRLIQLADQRLLAKDPTYEVGQVRLFTVFENPRAIFRIQEIADALHPYFAGGSLGWHDFLASTARLFRHDPNYRIPVKADPDIVIKHIRESHQILADSLDPIGGIKIGGMYGVLYEEGNEASFRVSMIGYIRDVFTQLKRGLDGFWVAHPDFVRLGIAMTEAWRVWEEDSNRHPIERLIHALLGENDESHRLIDFVFGPDVAGLDRDHHMYGRGVLAADLETSDYIANDDPEEVRYNIFQALQYFADWLSGNGCVALPAIAKDSDGNPVFVRIMDDLATTERSRWELWAEIQHGRVPRALFEDILNQEIEFIRHDESQPVKRVQVRWQGEAARWYPVAVKLLRQLVLDPEPVEFASELLLPFTFDVVRESDDPWATAMELNPKKYKLI